MTDFRKILNNAAWNLSGSLLPIAAAAALIPLIVSNLGLERFGLLSLAWVLIGYFSLFDFGLGRAITRMVAERVGTAREPEIASIVSTAMCVLLCLGSLGSLFVALLAWSGPDLLPSIPAWLGDEVRMSLFLIAATIPLVVATSGLRGVLEGFQEFRLLNLIRIPSGILLFAVPAATSVVSPRLDTAILGLALVRALILAAHLPPCLSRISMRSGMLDRKWILPMIQFGGWLTVSSIVGPVIVYLDRFLVGYVQSAQAVAFYSAPFEVVSRMLVLPMALTVAMFPVMVNLGLRNLAEAKRVRRHAVRLVLAISGPLCVVGLLLAEPTLRLWLGPEFAANSTLALQLLLPGFALNSLAQIPVVSLQSTGRAKSVALLHLMQLPVYALLLFALVKWHGIAGAAAAWSIRAAADCVALFGMLHVAEGNRLFRSNRTPEHRR